MRRLLSTCILVLLLCLPLFGQTAGQIAGTVTDSTGAVIPGATVTATNTDTNAIRTTSTNEAGIYAFPSLTPGVYDVKAETEGFQSMTRTGVQLAVQQIADVNMALSVGEVTQSIEVASDAAMLNTSDAVVGTVIDQQRIVDLPLNGRNYLQLIALSPNVTAGFRTPGQVGGRQGGDRGAQNYSLSGMRGTWNNYTLDGVANTDPNFNLYVMRPSVDALQEFKVQSGIYPAEFGRGAGQINVSTKAGGNDYHGAAFWFVRNDRFDARQYDFDGSKPGQQPFKWNQYGFVLSGPVSIPKVFNGKNKVFFMANWEGFKERDASVSTYTVPTQAMRGGDFSSFPATISDPWTGDPFPGNKIPSNMIHPTSAAMLEFLPAPNLSKTAVDRNYQRSRREVQDKDQFNLRIDVNESSNSQWFGRYSWTDEPFLNDGLLMNGSTRIARAKQLMVSNTRVVSPTKVNEFRFGYSWMYNEMGQELGCGRNVVEELGLPIPTEPCQSWGIPNIRGMGNYSGWGNGANGPFVIDDKIFQILDNFSWIHGKHSIRFGGEYRYDIYDQIGNEFARGVFEFVNKDSGDNFSDYLMSTMSKASVAVALAEANFRSHNLAFYFDDVYRITPKLSLNFGVRYEYFEPWRDKLDNNVNAYTPYLSHIPNDPNMAAHPILVRSGTGDFWEGKDFRYVGIQTERSNRFSASNVLPDKNNIAPRIGIAYNPTDKWVIRTGFGIFYNHESGNSRFDMNRGMGGRSAATPGETPDLNWDNFLPGGDQLPILIKTPFLWGVRPSVRDTYTMQYVFNIQRRLDTNTTFEIGYNGALHRKLQSLVNGNQPTPGTSPFSQRAPAPEFGGLQVVRGEGTGNYNGLGLKLTRRMSNGLTALVSYTWSKSLDQSSAIRGNNTDIFTNNAFCIGCDMGYSSFNTPHRLVTSVLWDIPFGRGRALGSDMNRVADALVGGWQIGSIITWQSGRAINMYAGWWDPPGTNTFGDTRLVASGSDPNLPSGQRTTERWWDMSAFYAPADGSFGNMSRNRMQGPTTLGWDFALHKSFALFEAHRLEFRFEAFNFPNHPRWGDPGNNFSTRNRNTYVDPNLQPSPNFGRIRGTRGNMRQLQFALKYVF
jgi:carboxypeptidase family protein